MLYIIYHIYIYDILYITYYILNITYSPHSACTTEGFLLALYSNSSGFQDCWWSA